MQLVVECPPVCASQTKQNKMSTDHEGSHVWRLSDEWVVPSANWNWYYWDYNSPMHLAMEFPPVSVCAKQSKQNHEVVAWQMPTHHEGLYAPRLADEWLVSSETLNRHYYSMQLMMQFPLVSVCERQTNRSLEVAVWQMAIHHEDSYASPLCSLRRLADEWLVPSTTLARYWMMQLVM